jgi:putative phosphoribosyl transferase
MKGDRHDYSSDRNESDSTPVEVRIPCGAVTLEGTLAIPTRANGVVVFASGSSRHSPRNQFVTRIIRESGNGTLLFDLLTAEEEIEDNLTRRVRYRIRGLQIMFRARRK